jgi:hypothetical protein
MIDPVSRYAVRGLWALPVLAVLLGAGTINHQPPPQTQLADWSRFVTTNEFLVSHLVASIGGAIFGVIGAVSLGIVLAQRGSIRLGLWGLVTGVSAQVLLSSIFGVAAYTQPAIGRFYLAGHGQLAQSLYYDAAQGTPMVVMALIALLLFASSFIVFGVAVVRTTGLPKLAGIGLAVSAVLFAVIGFALDNWIQSVASALMVACSVWIAVALSRPQPETADELPASLASSKAG